MDARPEPLPPIFTSHLLPKVEAKLIDLLRSLLPEEWEKQTLAPKWKVKDVAAHLLDTQLRKVAASKLGLKPPGRKITSHAELFALINTLNEEGVRKYSQLPTEDLIARMEVAWRESTEYHQSLDPFAPAMFPVSWAGEDESPNWFDTARELTERWHHQQQIRFAVDKPGIMTHELYHPVLDCFMRVLPYTYRNVPAMAGTFAQFNISGECGGSWYLYRGENNWQLVASPIGGKISETTIPQEIAWRIFTKGIAYEEARARVQVSGDAELGLDILKTVAIIG